MKSTTEKMSSSKGVSINDTLAEIIDSAGGLMNTRSAGALPKSCQQVSYFKSKDKTSGHNLDVLYNVMMQCKSSIPGKEFVRSVVAAPEPMAVLATDQQLNDMVRFLTNPVEFAIMGVDPTFNFGDFNVTPIVYRNLLLEHRTKGHSPLMLGPILVHQQKKFSSYNFFASTLIGLRPSLRNVLAFGTDGECELSKAFATNFPNAIHLRCFRHFRANLSSKLKDLAIPSSIADEFLLEIFGKTEDGIHTEGIVDAKDTEAFQGKLEALQEKWDGRERKCNPGKKPVFFNWFVSNKADEMAANMLRFVREAAGLGCPPSPYYTNDSECINSVMHNKTQYKASEWDQFNAKMQELVQQSHQLLEMAVLDRGAARFRDKYKSLCIDQLKWVKMTTKQREIHLRKVATAEVQGVLNCSEDACCSVPNNFDYSPLPVSPQEANLSGIPLSTVEGIWKKAKELLEKEGAVVNGPCFSGSSDRTVIVASKSSSKPYIVTCKPHGIISCESTCPNWAALRICSHAVAAAYFCSELCAFLEKYSKKKYTANLNNLAKIGMPKGAGKKGDIPPRKKKCPQTVQQYVDPGERFFQSSRPQIGEVTTEVTMTGHNYIQPPSYSYPPSVFNSPTVQCSQIQANYSHGFQMQPIHYPAATINNLQQPNYNPFILKFITGNIRICQSCRSSLRKADGSTYQAPFDLCISRLEKRPFWHDPSKTWCSPSRESNAHYCVTVSCVQASCAFFVPSTLMVPPEICGKLNDIHKNYLNCEFNMQL